MKKECNCDKSWKRHQQSRTICSYCDFIHNNKKVTVKRLPSRKTKAEKYAALVRYSSLPDAVMDALTKKYRIYQIYKRNRIVVFDDLSVLLLGYAYREVKKVISHHKQIGNIIFIDPITNKIYLDNADISYEMEDRIEVRICEQDDHHYNKSDQWPEVLMETANTLLLYNPYEIDCNYLVHSKDNRDMRVTTENFACAVQYFYWAEQRRAMKDVKTTCHLNDNE